MRLKNSLSTTRQKQIPLAAAVVLILNATNVLAAAIQDPTIPAPLRSEAESYNSTNAVTGPVLQSIMIGPGRKSAVISGELVKVGGKYKDATVVEIRTNSAVLENADKTRLELTMEYSGIKKSVIHQELKRK